MKKITFLFALCAMFMLGASKANAEAVKLDHTGWSISASSWCNEDGTSGKIAAAIDGAVNTYWHSNWGGNPAEGGSRGGGSTTSLTDVPEYIVLDLGALKSITQVGYVARNENGSVSGNGALMDYKLYVSETEFSVPVNCSNDEKKQVLELTGEAASGTLSDTDTSEQLITLAEPVSGRYIMLVWLSAGGPGGSGNYHANCAELSVYEYVDAVQEVTIKYNASVNGETRTISEETKTLGVGSTITAVAPAFTKIVGDASYECVAGTTEYVFTIEQDDAAIPFEVSASFAEAKWYQVRMHNSDSYFWQYNGETNVGVAAKILDEANLDKQQWCFVGNVFDGFKAYNKLAGETMTLSKPEVGNVNSVMSTEDTRNLFKIYKNNANAEGKVCFKLDGDNFYLNRQGSNIQGWNDNDAGSTCDFFVYSAVDAALSKAASYLISEDLKAYVVEKAGVLVGIPAYLAENYAAFETAYNNLNDDKENAEYLAALQEQLTAIQASEIRTLDTNKLYRFKNKRQGGYMGLKDGDATKAFVATLDETREDQKWELEVNGDGYKLKNASSGHYLGVVAMGGDQTTSMSETSGDVYKFNQQSGVLFQIKGNGGSYPLQVETGTYDGNLNGWSGEGSYWTIEEAGIKPVDMTALQALKDEATAVIALTGVGCPADTEENNALKAAVEALLAVDMTTENWETETRAALNAYKAITDIQMPEDGKAYTITNMQYGGATKQFYYTEENGLTVGADNEAHTGAEATFFCRVIDGKYVFVWENGKFLHYKGKGTTSNGAEAVYNADQGMTLVSTNDTKFGTFRLQTVRDNGSAATIVVLANGNFDGWGHTTAWAANYSNLFSFAEVADAVAPAIAVESASVENGEYEELVDSVVVKFDQPVFAVQDARFFVQSPRQAVALAESCITVGDSTVTIVAPAELLAGNYAANYMVTVENIFAQTATATLSYTKPLPPMEFVSVSPAADETVASLSTISMVFNDPTVDENSWDLGAIDETEGLIEVKNAAGEVVTTGTIGYGEAYDDIVITLAAPVAEDGTYTLVLPAGAVGNNTGTVFNEERTFTFNVLVPASVVSVDPAAGEVAEIPATITLTFSDEIESLGYANLFTNLMQRGQQLDIKETAVVNGNTVTLTIPVADEMVAGAAEFRVAVDAVGLNGAHVTYGDFAEGMINLEYNVAVEIDAATLEITSVEQVEDNKFVVTVLDPNAVTPRGDGTMVTLPEHEVAPVVVKNAAGETVATAVLGYGDGMNQVEMLIEEITEPGTYTLVIPEGTLWNGMYDPDAADYGVSMGAIYNAEYTYEFTVEAPAVDFTIVSVTPTAGSTVDALSQFVLTFSEAAAITAMNSPYVVNENGETVYRFTSADIEFDEDRIIATLTLGERITTVGKYKLVIPAYTFGNSDWSSFIAADEDITFTFGVGVTVGINGVTVAGAEGVYYDLSGRVVANPVKGGLYIVNGKKVIKK